MASTVKQKLIIAALTLSPLLIGFLIGINISTPLDKLFQ